MNKSFVCTEFFVAIIGVIGTLLGTVLGWLLNSFSQTGKIHVFIESWNEQLKKHDGFGGLVKCDSFVDADYYNYSLSVDIYNSSHDTKIMRDIHIAFIDDNNVYTISIPHNENTKTVVSSYVHYEDISTLNIPPKNVLTLNLSNGYNNNDEEWKQIIKSNRVVFVYLDEKNKKRQVDICK